MTVSDYRRDPVTGRWVVVGTQLPHPQDFVRVRVGDERAADAGECPLCEGQESRTASELWVHREHGGPNGPGWATRVIPNRAPLVRVEGTLDRRGEGLFDLVTGIGAHEVVVESPRHGDTLATIDDHGRARVLWALRERMQDLRRDIRLRHFLPFKNHGLAAGAALTHGHTQLLALPVVPREAREELDGARAHFAAKARCVFCDLVRQERADGRRIVLETPQFVALAPYASRAPFETWILPTEHMAHFETLDLDGCRALGASLGIVLRRVTEALDDAPYSMAIHTAPVPEGHEFYHWHVEILPRVTRGGGLEALGGLYLNPTPPEEAAAFLRSLAES
jgi:UDPglucose--hexose-1-phosphate uridylyltransferase